MRALTRLNFSAATMTILSASVATLGSGTASASSRVPINADLRNCDFSLVSTALIRPKTILGHGVANFKTSGSTVVADIDMMVATDPGTHFDVGLIQEPRPSSATCGPGDPGTSFSSLDTDAIGQGHVTITAPLRSGTTSVWVIVETGNPHDQIPGEFYTTEFLSSV